jgi:hypothetical protein
MLTSYYAARANLYYLWKKHPEWKHGQFAAALGYSKEWVKKWLKRLQEELAEDLSVFSSVANLSVGNGKPFG